jgi:hypothetical protein
MLRFFTEEALSCHLAPNFCGRLGIGLVLWTQDQTAGAKIKTIEETLAAMQEIYSKDPVAAVRGQHFIKTLHGFIADDLRSRIHPSATKEGVEVQEESTVFGSHKTKDVDVAIIHPTSGPLVLVGVRSQMSSIGKNVLTYYQDIVGEAVSLQDRFPMTTHAYCYLHPLSYTDEKKVSGGAEVLGNRVTPDHARYARMYRAITGRDDRLYKNMSGIYDEFAYMVVDFASPKAELRDDVVTKAVPDTDLSITTFVDRIVDAYKRRNIWFDLFI